jgi:hypothetical protein
MVTGLKVYYKEIDGKTGVMDETWKEIVNHDNVVAAGGGRDDHVGLGTATASYFHDEFVFTHNQDATGPTHATSGQAWKTEWHRYFSQPVYAWALRFEISKVNSVVGGCNAASQIGCGMRAGIIADVFEADKTLQWNCTAS